MVATSATHGFGAQGILRSVTIPKPPLNEPPGRRRAPQVASVNGSSSDTTRAIALVALAVALVVLGITAWRLIAPGGAGCQTDAWNVRPAAADLPAEWTVSATQFDLDRQTISLLGPQPADATVGQAVIYTTVTCFDRDAADAVERSKAAASAAGQVVEARPDLGNQGFVAVDDSGAIFIQFRTGDIVVYVAASGDATATEADQVASAFDKALGGDGGTIAPAESPAGPDASADTSADPLDPGSSAEAGSPAAPDMIAALPTKVGSITLATDSLTGTTFLADDQGSRAILATLRAAGKGPDDLHVAQAYDELGESDLTLLALGVEGMPAATLEKLVINSWLAASGEGVTRDTVTLAGKTWTRLDYGDGGTLDYVLAERSPVIVITTSDPKLAAEAAAALP